MLIGILVILPSSTLFKTIFLLSAYPVKPLPKVRTLERFSSFFSSYTPGLMTAPVILTIFSTGLTNITSPDLNLVLKVDFPKIKISYKST